MTDTPPPAPAWPPTSRLEQIRVFIGELARPFAVVALALSTSIAIVIIALRITDGAGGAIFITPVLTGLGAIYGVKSWELAKAGKQDADVKIAQAASPTGTPT